MSDKNLITLMVLAGVGYWVSYLLALGGLMPWPAHWIITVPIGVVVVGGFIYALRREV